MKIKKVEVLEQNEESYVVEVEGEDGSVIQTKTWVGGASGSAKVAEAPKVQESSTGTPACPICGGETVEKSGTSKKTGKPFRFFGCKRWSRDGGCQGKVWA